MAEQLFSWHTGNITHAQMLSRDRLLSWHRDENTLCVWNIASGELLTPLEGHTDSIRGAMALPADQLVSWSRDKTLRVWNSESGELKALIEGHTDWVNGALALPCGRLLSWSNDHTLRIWDVETGQSPVILKGHTGHVCGAHALPDGKILSCSGYGDSTLRMWDTKSGKQLATLYESDNYGLTYALVLPENKFVSWLEYEPLLHLRDAGSGKILAMMEGHTDKVRGVMMLSDGRLLSWSADGDMRIWDCESGALLMTIEGEDRYGGKEAVLGVVELPDGRLFSYTGPGSYFHDVWDVQSGEHLATLNYWREIDEYAVDTLEGSLLEIEDALALPDGRLLTWTWGHPAFRLWDSGSGEWLDSLEVDPSYVIDALMLPDGRILTWSYDKMIRIWRV